MESFSIRVNISTEDTELLDKNIAELAELFEEALDANGLEVNYLSVTPA